MVTTIDQVVRAMGGSLLRGEGIYFLGSEISAGSGLPEWLGLIRDIASPLELKSVTENDDLPRIAQYCINADHGNRGPLVGRLKRALSPHVQRPNPYHRAISRTNVTTIWTTNFDILVESALATTRLAVRANDAHLTGGTRDFDVELLKIHGCIDRSKADELVLTQEDYENFSTRRPALAERLRHDLIHNSLLFLGYSYRDPNIATTLVEVRRLSGGATTESFALEASMQMNVPERGLPPGGIKPPIPDADQCKPGWASRPSERQKGGQSLWDPRGGEWRYFPGDPWHNPHWDYNPHDSSSSPWQNIPIGNLPPRK